jgi:arylsulfate sulfotransferase
MRCIQRRSLAVCFLLQAVCVGGCSRGSLQSNVTPNTAAPLAPAAVAPAAFFSVVSATGNPQVARYTVVTPQAADVTVDFGLDTNYGLRTWTQPTTKLVPGKYDSSVLVAGMRAFTTYHMRARMQLADGTEQLDSDHTFTTGGLPPSRVPKVRVTRPAGMVPNPGIELIDVVSFLHIPNTDPVDVAAFDLNGNLIWFYDLQDGQYLDCTFPIKLLPSGNFLMVVLGPTNEVREINLAGETVSEFNFSDVNVSLSQAGSSISIASLHHDILPLPNGHVILLANAFKTYTNLPNLPGDTSVLGDVLIDLDEHRNPVWMWSTFDHLDVNRQPLGFPDWTHSNAVIYSPDDGNLILSMRNQDWVIKIDYRDGRGDGGILWRMGPGGDFVIPGGGPADFNYAQHYPVLIGPRKSGVFPLMMFDNGNGRIVDALGTQCGAPGAPACYSRPVIFQLDETSKTAQILWQYKLPIFSGCCGSINVLENGNAEYDIALVSTAPLSSRIQEVTQDSAPQLVWQMDLTGQLGYRAFRMPSLYPGVEWKTTP